MNEIENLDFVGNTLLIAGVNTRPVVKSAKELGFKTIVVDNFGDLDVEKYSDVLIVKENQSEKSQDLFDLTLKALNSYEVDATIITSGMEHSPQKLDEIGKKTKIIGNKPEKMDFCRKEDKIFRKADTLGIPHPETRFRQNLESARKSAKDIGYPVLLKPSPRGGGIGIKLAKTPEELEFYFKEISKKERVETILVQQYIDGIDASCSVLSNGRVARALTTNRQIIGERRLGVPRKFGYCGGVVPLEIDSKTSSKIAKYSRTICEEIGLVGSNGVDFVVSKDKPYLIEVNPRFQNTMDLVEGVLEINLLREHIRTCQGEIGKYDGPLRWGTKLITYAKKTIKVPDLSSFSGIVDIPKEGSIIENGSPICSVLRFGEEKKETIDKAFDTADNILEVCHN